MPNGISAFLRIVDDFKISKDKGNKCADVLYKMCSRFRNFALRCLIMKNKKMMKLRIFWMACCLLCCSHFLYAQEESGLTEE